MRRANQNTANRIILFIILLLIFGGPPLLSQKTTSLKISEDRGLRIGSVNGIPPGDLLPVFSLYLNGQYLTSLDFRKENGVYRAGTLECHTGVAEDSAGLYIVTEFIFRGKDSLMFQGFVPLSEDPSHTRISARLNSVHGNPWLYIPGELPMGVTIPGMCANRAFTSAGYTDGLRISTLSSLMPLRVPGIKSMPGHFLLYPGGSLEYRIKVVIHENGWEEGYRILQGKGDS